MFTPQKISLTILIAAFSQAVAVSIRVATYNVQLGLEAPDTTGHTAALAVLKRIDADVVALQEVNIADEQSGSLASFADHLGYPYRFVPSGALDSQSRVALLSRYPFKENTTQSIISPNGANEMTRAAAIACIDVPETNQDPYFITAHLKCCNSRDSDAFRRAVEMLRIKNHLNALQLNKNDNVFFMGDFNLLPNDRIYNSLPADLPASYVLGDDVEFDVIYHADPTAYFTQEGLLNPGYLQQDQQSPATYSGGSVLDYILVSESILARNFQTEIYNTALDSTYPGLAKEGLALSASTGTAASDHFALFGDFELDSGLPLTLTISPKNLSENSPPATITISLPDAQEQPITVSLTFTDQTEFQLSSSTVTFNPGEITKTLELTPRGDNQLDGAQTVIIEARAPGFDAATIDVTITNSDLPFYEILQLNDPLVEAFTNFEGTQSKAPINLAGLTWRGIDDGSSTIPGARSYGGNSLGLLTNSPTTLIMPYTNRTQQTLTSLRVSYLATQWHSTFQGSDQSLCVSLTSTQEHRLLRELSYAPAVLEPSGRITPPIQSQKQSYLRGLSIAPQESFSLIFELTSETNLSERPSDVFINEFHYDNQGLDDDEFIEIAVGEAFDGDLSEIQIQLYNGNNRSPYGLTHSLSTFIEGAQDPSGYRFYYKNIAGIQNGAPDGIALIINGVVKEFLSYEGAFSAIGGSADQMMSTNIGVAQNGSTPLGSQSLALLGSGKKGRDFTWSVQPDLFTKGFANTGQTFEMTTAPQGIGIDNITMIALSDQDGDLLSDEEESLLGTHPFKKDTDGDGQDDFFEAILAETNPLDRTSLLEIDLRNGDPQSLSVTFPTLKDRIYYLESTTDLQNWFSGTPYLGDGQPLEISLSKTKGMYLRVRIFSP